MQAHRIEATVQPNGKIVLENLPFDEGEAVEIIVLETKAKSKTGQKSLRGTLLKYENPFEPVAVEDWEALK